MTMLHALVTDVRYGLRHLLHTPKVSLVVIVTVAMSLGANIALFSLLNALVLRPLPVQAPQRLAVVSQVTPQGELRVMPLDTSAELARQTELFQAVAAYSGGGVFTTEANGGFAATVIEGVTGAYYDDVLGVRPFLGRLISRQDVASAGESAPVVVLGYQYWQRQFGGSPAAVGQTIRIEGLPLLIVGVTPPGFSGLRVETAPDVAVPLPLLSRIGAAASQPRRPPRSNYVVVKLREGVTVEDAKTRLRTLWPSIQTANATAALSPSERQELGTLKVQVDSIATGFSTVRGRYENTLYLLVGLGLLLLLVACSNVSGLLLSQSATRADELRIRLALGASRGRLLRQFAAEGLLLALAATVVALPLAWWASQALARVLFSSFVLTAPTVHVTPDWRVFGTAVAVSVVCGFAIGVIPLWAASRGPHNGVPQSRRATRAVGSSGKVLLILQVALSVVFAFAAGLFATSLSNAHAVNTGFHPEGLLCVTLGPRPDGYTNMDQASYYPELVRRLSAVAGVRSVSFSRLFPSLNTENGIPESVASIQQDETSGAASATMDVVSPGLFETAGIPIRQGRGFTWQDDVHHPAIAMVNESLARLLFPSGNVIGQRIRLGADPARQDLQIVGLVANATMGNPRIPDLPMVFRPWLQEPRYARYASVEIRTESSAIAVGEGVRSAVASLGREYVRAMRSVTDQLDVALVRERLAATLSSLFAALALSLACLGLYAILAFRVAERTREIGIRMALGASRAAVLSMVLVEAATVSAVGVAVGIPAALTAGRWMGSLLFGLTPSNPHLLTVAGACCFSIGMIAGLLPAYRAASIDPVIALRLE